MDHLTGGPEYRRSIEVLGIPGIEAVLMGKLFSLFPKRKAGNMQSVGQGEVSSGK